jgi:hypothetical protein
MGLLSYFVAAFVTYQVTVESNVHFMEGEGTNVSQAYHQWEISVWPQAEGDAKEVTAIDTRGLREGRKVVLENLGIEVLLRSFYPNAQAYVASESANEGIINQSGIGRLTKIAPDKEPEKNVPGCIIELHAAGQKQATLLLYGAESSPQTIAIGGKQLNVQLRRQHYPLPFFIKLKDFEMEVHPGTETASSYKSLVTMEHDGISRDVLIWMNHPLRFKDYTLYQASYAIDQFGREYSTLAVVKNAGWPLPYIASFITLAGLLIHFLSMAFAPKGKNG